MTINAVSRSFACAPSSDGVRYTSHPNGDAIAGPGPTTGLMFTDGFETGDKSHTENSVAWGGSTNAAVQASRGNPGYALQFTFTGTASGSDATAEQRFDLGALYSELTITFDLYVPDGAEAWGGAAYAHRNDSPNNNKFFRLWPVTYDDRTKVGASLLRSSNQGVSVSDTRSEWAVDGGGVGTKGAAAASIITPSDLGTWIAIKLYCKAATASVDGTLQIYKNGALIIDNDGTVDNYHAEHPEGWRFGYLFGWSNSGFDATTYLQVDNVRIYEGVVA